MTSVTLSISPGRSPYPYFSDDTKKLVAEIVGRLKSSPYTWYDDGPGSDGLALTVVLGALEDVEVLAEVQHVLTNRGLAVSVSLGR